MVEGEIIWDCDGYSGLCMIDEIEKKAFTSAGDNQVMVKPQVNSTFNKFCQMLIPVTHLV